MKWKQKVIFFLKKKKKRFFVDIIHRDLKPENLLFKDIPTDFTNISIADFGFASEITFDKHLFPKLDNKISDNLSKKDVELLDT